MILSKYKLIVIENIKARFISTVTFDPESRFGRATDIVSSEFIFFILTFEFNLFCEAMSYRSNDLDKHYI